MIDPAFLVSTPQGLYCRAGDFYLDPSQPVRQALVSHAHGDHAARGLRHVVATAPTLAIMQHRDHGLKTAEMYTAVFGEDFELNGVRITYLPAGHILGSAQILLEHGGARYLYTGDLKLQTDTTCEPAVFCRADVLITETTFANPSVIHPEPVQEMTKLNAIRSPILLGAYSLGKSQRLIALMNRYCPEKKILIHHRIAGINQIYRQFDFDPGVWAPYSRKLMKEAGNQAVYIVPPLTFNSYFRANNLVRVFASGWDRLQVPNGVSLFISDHIDWHDILDVVNRVGPTEIWTVHGDGSYLAGHYRDRLNVRVLS